MDTQIPSFNKGTIGFLRRLKRNNQKTWFDSHRDEYEASIRTPGRAFIDSLKPLFKAKFPSVRVDYRSMYRINRDIRFSDDKTPYKTWAGFLFRDQQIKTEDHPAFYVGFDPTGIALGCGNYQFSKPFRDHFRTRVTEGTSAKAFRAALLKAKRAGFEPHGKSLKRIPPGFDPKHPNAEFLLHNGLYLSKEIDFPKEFWDPSFAKYVMKAFDPCKPFFEWFLEVGKDAPKLPTHYMSFDDEKFSDL